MARTYIFILLMKVQSVGEYLLWKGSRLQEGTLGWACGSLLRRTEVRRGSLLPSLLLPAESPHRLLPIWCNLLKIRKRKLLES